VFAVCFTDDAARDVKALPKAVRNSLRKAIVGTLAVDPVRHSTELRSPLEEFRSFH
jgi:mRNA-degrading endonuclease RelE of RelBE toxin-antitoxin system